MASQSLPGLEPASGPRADAAGRFVHVVKMVCGVQAECACGCSPVVPGMYATSVSIHNDGLRPVRIVKRFIPVALAGAVIGRAPRFGGARVEEHLVLPPQSAMFDDCCRLAEWVFGAAPAGPQGLTIGLLEISASAELAVTAFYTTSGDHASPGVAIEVTSFAACR